jgi:biopolymer transport protein ExbD
MKGFLLVVVLLCMFSCNKECDCEKLNKDFFQSEKIDLPKNNEPALVPETSLDIFIDENNLITVNAVEISLEALENKMVKVSEKDNGASIKVFVDSSSNFSAFNDVLNLSRMYYLRLVIAQQ